MRLVLVLLTMGLTLAPWAPGGAQEVSVGGQIRPRFEFRDPMPGSTENAFTSMRVRATVRAELDRRVEMLVQIQDVRLWGEETSTLADFRADNLDLHQAFVQAAFGRDGWLTARAGREELNLGGQRLIGAVGWTQQGRSFDGVRATAARPWGKVDVLAYKLSEANAPDIAVDSELLGAYGVLDVTPSDALDVYGFYTRSTGEAETRQGSLGARLHGGRAGFTYRGEATAQVGRRGGQDVRAYMFGARGGRQVRGGDAEVTLWYDFLSGDPDAGDGRVEVFETLFATNHKFYGFADLFLNIPLDTGGLGLQDVALKASHRVGASGRLAVDLHHFATARRGALSTRSLGREIDVTFTYRHTPNLSVVTGLSQVFAGNGFKELGRLTEDMTFMYVMLDGAF